MKFFAFLSTFLVATIVFYSLGSLFNVAWLKLEVEFTYYSNGGFNLNIGSFIPLFLGLVIAAALEIIYQKKITRTTLIEKY